MGVSIPLSDQAPMRYNFVPLVEPLCQLKAAPLVLVPIRAAVVSLLHKKNILRLLCLNHYKLPTTIHSIDYVLAPGIFIVWKLRLQKIRSLLPVWAKRFQHALFIFQVITPMERRAYSWASRQKNPPWADMRTGLQAAAQSLPHRSFQLPLIA